MNIKMLLAAAVISLSVSGCVIADDGYYTRPSVQVGVGYTYSTSTYHGHRPVSRYNHRYDRHRDRHYDRPYNGNNNRWRTDVDGHRRYSQPNCYNQDDRRRFRDSCDRYFRDHRR